MRPSGPIRPAKLCNAARGHIFNLRVCYKVTQSFKRLGIPPSVIFTRAAQNQPTITVMTIGEKMYGRPCFRVRLAIHLQNVWSSFLIRKLKHINTYHFNNCRWKGFQYPRGGQTGSVLYDVCRMMCETVRFVTYSQPLTFSSSPTGRRAVHTV